MVLLELWKPPPDKLNTYFILGEIVFNVNQLSEEHPNIDTDMLRALADGIRDDHVETEDALRALCQIFRDTYSFDFSLDQLDSTAKTQVTAFVEGRSATEVVARGFDTAAPLGPRHGFKFSEHLRDVTKLHRHEGPVHKVITKAMARFSNHPIIYENIEKTKVMEVRSERYHVGSPSSVYHADLRRRPFPKLGTKRKISAILHMRSDYRRGYPESGQVFSWPANSLQWVPTLSGALVCR